MAVIGKVLNQGFISSASSAIYTVPSDTASTYVKLFTIYNSGLNTENILISLSGSSATTTFARVQLLVSESAHIIDKDSVLMLNTGNAILAYTSTPSSVEYTITGGTE